MNIHIYSCMRVCDTCIVRVSVANTRVSVL